MSIRDIAKRSVSLSEVMDGKEKISTEEIFEHYEKGFLIDDVDTINYNNEQVWVYSIKKSNYFGFAGSVLANVFNNVLNSYKGDLTAVREDLKQEPLGVRLYPTKNREGRNYTAVEIL